MIKKKITMIVFSVFVIGLLSSIVASSMFDKITLINALFMTDKEGIESNPYILLKK